MSEDVNVNTTEHTDESSNEQVNNNDAPQAITQFDKEYKSPILEKIENMKDASDVLNVIHGNYGEVSEIINNINTDTSEANMLKSIIRRRGSEAAVSWLSSVSIGINHILRHNPLDKSVQWPGARWVQGMLLNDKRRNITRPNIAAQGVTGTDLEEGIKTLTGMSALMRARKTMHRGDGVLVPLTHTGMWVVMEVEGDDAWVNMQLELAQDRVVIGRSTNGLVFNNLDGIIYKHMAQFLVGSIIKTSIGTTDRKELFKIIKAQDVYTLAHSYLTARFKRGYDLTTACVERNERNELCGALRSDRVALAQMLITDDSRISKEQVQHMNRDSGHTIESLVAYQECFDFKRKFEITEGVSIHMQTPSIQDKIDNYNNWVSAIEESLPEVFNEGTSASDRENAIHTKANMTSCRGLAHWISSISFGTDEVITSRKDIEAVIGEFTTDPEIATAINHAVIEYAASMSITIVAVPRWTCTECNKMQPASNQNFQAFTPLNVEKTFFTLMTRALTQIYEREEV